MRFTVTNWSDVLQVLARLCNEPCKMRGGDRISFHRYSDNKVVAIYDSIGGYVVA